MCPSTSESNRLLTSHNSCPIPQSSQELLDYHSFTIKREASERLECSIAHFLLSKDDEGLTAEPLLFCGSYFDHLSTRGEQLIQIQLQICIELISRCWKAYLWVSSFRSSCVYREWERVESQMTKEQGWGEWFRSLRSMNGSADWDWGVTLVAATRRRSFKGGGRRWIQRPAATVLPLIGVITITDPL